MREDESSLPLGTIDPEAMRRFGMWMAKGPSADRVEIFQEITEGDELGGLALASLCDLELARIQRLLHRRDTDSELVLRLGS